MEQEFLTIRQKNGEWSSFNSGIWNCRIAIMFILFYWVHTFTFNTKYFFYLCKINLYLNLVSSAADFAYITLVISVPHKKWISLALFWIQRERPWPAFCLFLLVAYLRSLYLIMELLVLLFIPSVNLSGCLEEKLIFFGLLPIM